MPNGLSDGVIQGILQIGKEFSHVITIHQRMIHFNRDRQQEFPLLRKIFSECESRNGFSGFMVPRMRNAGERSPRNGGRVDQVKVMRARVELLLLEMLVDNFPSRIVELSDRFREWEIAEGECVVFMQNSRSAVDGVEQDDCIVQQPEPEFDRLVDGLEDIKEKGQMKRKAVFFAHCMHLRGIHMRADIEERIVIRFEEPIRVFPVPLLYVEGCIHARASILPDSM